MSAPLFLALGVEHIPEVFAGRMTEGMGRPTPTIILLAALDSRNRLPVNRRFLRARPARILLQGSLSGHLRVVFVGRPSPACRHV